MAEHGVSEMEFYRINPFIRCDKLRRTSEVCIGQGYFHADKCVETLRVTGTNLNCSTLAAQLPIDEETLRTLNPFLNCSGEIVSDALVCVHSLGGLPTTAARDKLFNALKVASPLLAERYARSRPMRVSLIVELWAGQVRLRGEGMGIGIGMENCSFGIHPKVRLLHYFRLPSPSPPPTWLTPFPEVARGLNNKSPDY